MEIVSRERLLEMDNQQAEETLKVFDGDADKAREARDFFGDRERLLAAWQEFKERKNV